MTHDVSLSVQPRMNAENANSEDTAALPPEFAFIGGFEIYGFIYSTLRFNQPRCGSPMEPINREVRVEREDSTTAILLSHADKTSIGERHRHIAVAVH